jgi:hypothetical protein
LAGSPERTPFHADSSDAHTVADLIVRTDDQRRDGIDLCCNVVMDTWDADRLVMDDDADPSLPPLFVAFFGAAYADSAPEDASPAGYVAQAVRPWERPGVEPGTIRTFDGFETPDELFSFVNGVLAFPLVRVSWDATLNPPGEGEGEGEGE